MHKYGTGMNRNHGLPEEVGSRPGKVELLDRQNTRTKYLSERYVDTSRVSGLRGLLGIVHAITTTPVELL